MSTMMNINLINFTSLLCAHRSPDVGGAEEEGLENGRNVPIRGDDSVSDVHPAGSCLLIGLGAR